MAATGSDGTNNKAKAGAKPATNHGTNRDDVSGITPQSKSHWARWSHWVADVTIAKPWRSMGLMLVLLVLAGAGLGRLQADFTHRGFFHADDPRLLAFDAFERRFGNDDAVVLIMHSPSGIFDVDSAHLLRDLTEALWKVPEVIRVDSVSNYQWVHASGDDIEVEPLLPDDIPLNPAILAQRRAVALGHEVLPNYLISEDGKTASLFARIKPGIEAPPNAPVIVGAIRDLIEKKGRTDHLFHIMGGPAITLAFNESAYQDMGVMIPMVFLVAIIALLIIYRSFVGVALTLAVVMTSIIATLGCAGWLGIRITNLTSIVPQILVAIGIADAVHIVVSYLLARSKQQDHKQAIHYSLMKNAQPTLLTSLTTAAGFMSFATAEVKAVADLGAMASMGTLIAWVSTYLLLGPLLTLIPLRGWRSHGASAHGHAGPWAGALTHLLARRRRPVMIGFAFATLLAAGLATQNTVNSNPYEYFAEGYWLRNANDFVQEHVGGAVGLELVIDAGEPESIKDPAFLKKVDGLQTWISQQPKVTKTSSVIDVLKQTHRSLHGDQQAFYRLPDNQDAIAQELFLYTMSLPQGMDINDRITIKNDAVRLTVLWTINDSREAMAAVDRFVAKGIEMGLDLTPTGKMYLYQGMNGYVVRSFLFSLTLAVVLISTLLIVFFRSFKLGLLAMIPNFAPLIVGGAVLWWIGHPLDVGTMIVSSVCLGIAVDDTIHILANYRRFHLNGYSRAAAVAQVLTDTAPALLVTSVVLVFSFGTFIFATFIPNLFFGVLTAIVLAVALAFDLTLVPALLLGSHAQESGLDLAPPAQPPSYEPGQQVPS